MQPVTPILVPEDTIYQGVRRDNSALLFWRTASTPVSGSQIVLKAGAPRPPTFLFNDPFISVYAVVEAFQQVSVTPVAAAAGTIGMFKASYRPPEVEPEYARANHQLFFQVQRVYGLQITFEGYTLEVPDLNDNPWLEWVHPPQSPQAALYPFRSYGTPQRGQQFNLFYGQPPSPRLDPEADTINRQYSNWHVITRMAPTVAKVITSCGDIWAYDMGNGTIVVTWGPFGGGPPDSYNVYVNGVLNQNVSPAGNRQAYITGLKQTSYSPGPPPLDVPPTTYTITVNAVSAGVDASPSQPFSITVQPTSIQLTTPMKRLWPFPNSTLD
jgi:hypothetical protein